MLMMMLCNVVLKVLNRKETHVFNNFKILELLTIVSIAIFMSHPTVSAK